MIWSTFAYQGERSPLPSLIPGGVGTQSFFSDEGMDEGKESVNEASRLPILRGGAPRFCGLRWTRGERVSAPARVGPLHGLHV